MKTRPRPAARPSAPSNTTPIRTAAFLRNVYDRLWSAYGPQHWWPGETPAEIVVGAILTQNTDWRNVERAIENLKRAECLTWQALRRVPREKLAKLIQPSGTYRLKAGRLKAFVRYLWNRHAGSLESLLGGDLEAARRGLLSIPGVGPETADSILLYAGNRPTFVVDTYTRRVLRRHLVIDGRETYEELRRFFQLALSADARLYSEYHALFVAVGKHHCRARAACDACPLADLPHDSGA